MNRPIFGLTLLFFSSCSTPDRSPPIVTPNHRLTAAEPSSRPENKLSYVIRDYCGWTVHIRSELLQPDKKIKTEKDLIMIILQLENVIRVVPSVAVEELKKIPFWISPAYAGVLGHAEYHLSEFWLRLHQRDIAMCKSIEFTNLKTLTQDFHRVPMFVLHELAHGYHDRVLGIDQPDILACYNRARTNKFYDKVARKDAQGKLSPGVKSYAMTNPLEFFAETSEAFFGENEFYPFNRTDLEQHDPETVAMLKKVWHVE